MGTVVCLKHTRIALMIFVTRSICRRYFMRSIDFNRGIWIPGGDLGLDWDYGVSSSFTNLCGI